MTISMMYVPCNLDDLSYELCASQCIIFGFIIWVCVSPLQTSVSWNEWWKQDVIKIPDIVRSWAIEHSAELCKLLERRKPSFLFDQPNNYTNFKGVLQQWTPCLIFVGEWCISYLEKERFSIQFYYQGTMLEVLYISPDVWWKLNIFFQVA